MDIEVKKVLFLSSGKHLQFAETAAHSLHKALKRYGYFYDCVTWSEPEVIGNNGSTFHELVKRAEELSQNDGFAVCVFAPDDLVRMGEDELEVYSTRDNVVFEFGLMLGALGKDRVFYLYNSGTVEGKEMHYPSDLDGINGIRCNHSHFDGYTQEMAQHFAEKLCEKISSIRAAERISDDIENTSTHSFMQSNENINNNNIIIFSKTVDRQSKLKVRVPFNSR